MKKNNRVTSISPPRELTDLYGVSRSDVVEALQELGNYKIAERFGNCDQQYSVVYCPSCNNHHAYPLHCKTRICYQCGERRQAMIFDKIKPRLEALKKSKDMKLLTLTLPKVPDGEYGRGVYDDWTSWFRDFRYNSFVKKRLRGGMYAIETIRRYSNQDWYVHLHAMIESEYLPQRVVGAVWRKVTGFGKIVDIREVKVKGGYGEVTKYVTKPPRLSSGMDYAHYIEATKGKRAFQTFGTFYNWDMDIKPDREKLEKLRKCGYCGHEKTTFVGSVEYEEALDYMKGNEPVGSGKWS